MKIRERLLPLLTWKIGDGNTCAIYAQPWAEGVVSIRPPQRDSATRQLVLRDLTDQVSEQWDVNKLVELFGYRQGLHIVANIQPPRRDAGHDKLIFKLTVNGEYSVKQAYNHLEQLRNIETRPGDKGKSFWELIWKKGEVQPRIRLFLWKAVKGALPLGQILKSRISKGNPTCYLCGEQEEDVNHLLFKCQFARQCWFGGPLALKSDLMGSGFAENMELLGAQVKDGDWNLVLNSCWAIWRCRNSVCMRGSHQLSTNTASSYRRPTGRC